MRQLQYSIFIALIPTLLGGCYAPLSSPGIPANQLNETFRFPRKSNEVELNFTNLTRDVPLKYVLGPDDVIRVEISEISPFQGLQFDEQNRNPQTPSTRFSQVESKINAEGRILLPLIGSVNIDGLTVDQATQKVVETYADKFLDDPKVSISLIEKSTVGVMVLGGVTTPGYYRLAKYENDIAHAIAAAGGLQPLQTEIQVHRKLTTALKNGLPQPEKTRPPENQADLPPLGQADNSSQSSASGMQTVATPRQPTVPHHPQMATPYPQTMAQYPQTMAQYPQTMAQYPQTMAQYPQAQIQCQTGSPCHGRNSPILRIPMRHFQPIVVTPQDAELSEGDVVIAKKAPDEVFFVVGQLNTNNQVRFAVNEVSRDLGNGFLLPRDRDVDVVMAVVMAGYIDPINSPTTVTVHRRLPDGSPLLIKVDLIAARFNRSETIMVQPGDIIYLNPDPAWWMRRTFDRIVPALFTSPYNELMQRTIDPQGFN